MKQLLVILFALFSLLSTAQKKNTQVSSYNYQRGVDAVMKDNMDEGLSYLLKEIKDDPKNGYAYTWLTVIRQRQQLLGDALTDATLAIKHLPKKDAEFLSYAYLKRAQIYRELGNPDMALADCSSAIKERPDYEEGYKFRALVYYEQQQYDLSVADYRKVISLAQGNVMAYAGMGRNLNAQKRWDEAIEQFDYVAKLDPKYSEAYAFRAQSYLGKKDWDRATDDIVKALEIDRNDRAFEMIQSLDDGAFNRLKVKFQIKSVQDSHTEMWLYFLGVIHETREMYPQAIKYYEEAYSRDMSVYLLERIETCCDNDFQYEKGLSVADMALGMEPDSWSWRDMKANMLYGLGRFHESMVLMDSVLAQNPDYSWGYFRRAACKNYLGDTDRAIEDMNISIVLKPDFPHSYIRRAGMYERQGQKELANADYQKAIEIDEALGSHDASVFAYQALGDEKKAIELMDTIIASDSTSSINYYEAACLYSRMNRKEEALDYLETSLRMGYRSFFHIEADYDMDNIKQTPRFKELLALYRSKAASVKYDVEDDKSVQSESTVYEVPFTKDGRSSICNVKCTINDLPLYFIFDTGASDVSLSQVEATFMMKNGYISSKDVVGSAYFSDAVGNVSVGTVINLRDVNFGGLRLTNVKASVVQNQKAPLLLGQSVLGRLGRIEIDNAQNVLRITQK